MRRLRWVIALAVLAGATLVVAGASAGGGLLCLAPALALAATLWARRYPGERLLLSFAARRRRDRRRPLRVPPPSRMGALRVPRGGLLMGFALAVRPPPRCAVA